MAAAFAHAIPARPEAVATLRHALRAWLSDAGVSEEEQYEAVIAAGEAVANSVEHAYSADGRGLIELEGRLLENGPLELVIRDHGVWRDLIPESHRGRGRAMMGTLMDGVVVESGDGGTTVRLHKRLRQQTGHEL